MAVQRDISKLDRRCKNKFGKVFIRRDYLWNFSALLANQPTAGSVDPARENVIQMLIGSVETT
jgi:hypothetical protein